MWIYFKYILSSIFSKNRGFTLVELMIVIAIASILMTTVVVQQRKWDDNLSVSTQNFDLGMTVRQAQVYGLGAREDKVGSEGDKFNVGYGVYVNLRSFGGNDTQYIFFADRDGDSRYDAGEEIETKTFTKGVTINKICGIRPTNGAPRCSNTSDSIGYPKRVDIIFLRPAPGTTITFRNNSGNVIADSGGNGLIPPVSIYLESLNGKISSTTIDASGQVSISQ